MRGPLRPALAGLAALAAVPALAEPDLPQPAPPQPGPLVAEIEVGVFCALQAMDRAPAPGTLSGWIHVPRDQISFHWPDRQVVPAALGLAFGVKARMQPGVVIATGEMRVFRPDSAVPEVWPSGFNDLDGSLAFFRFDHAHEMVAGPWRFEAWDGDRLLYSVAFEVVPAAALPRIAQACGATS